MLLQCPNTFLFCTKKQFDRLNNEIESCLKDDRIYSRLFVILLEKNRMILFDVTRYKSVVELRKRTRQNDRLNFCCI